MGPSVLLNNNILTCFQTNHTQTKKKNALFFHLQMICNECKVHRGFIGNLQSRDLFVSCTAVDLLHLSSNNKQTPKGPSREERARPLDRLRRPRLQLAILAAVRRRGQAPVALPATLVAQPPGGGGDGGRGRARVRPARLAGNLQAARVRGVLGEQQRPLAGAQPPPGPHLADDFRHRRSLASAGKVPPFCRVEGRLSPQRPVEGLSTS
mmetsp:Transcript_13029/g.21434  ORF Transcript_13029/g.21434 Transcript_13029/m.21434 type:complete len:209 (+) Transcript_13029:137-763(+)